MLTRRGFSIAGAAGLAALGFTRLAPRPCREGPERTYEVTHTDAEWRKLLTPDAI